MDALLIQKECELHYLFGDQHLRSEILLVFLSTFTSKINFFGDPFFKDCMDTFKIHLTSLAPGRKLLIHFSNSKELHGLFTPI